MQEMFVSLDLILWCIYVAPIVYIHCISYLDKLQQTYPTQG